MAVLATVEIRPPGGYTMKIQAVPRRFAVFTDIRPTNSVLTEVAV
jgi:hypothetical protein